MKNPEISFILEKIRSRLIKYIKNFTNNHEVLLDKLNSIDNFIKKKLSMKNINLNNFDVKENTSPFSKDNLFSDNKGNYALNNTLINSFENEKILSSYQYIIIKLRRKLKKQHEKFQLQELAYLERISILQKKLENYEKKEKKHINISNTNRNINKETVNKPKINLLLNSTKIRNINSFEKRKDIGNNNFNKKIKIYNKNDNNKIFSQTFSELKYNKKLFNEVEISKIDYNFEDSKNKNKENIVEQKLFLNKYLISLKNHKLRNRTINTAIKHNLKEINKEIENSKKKILLLKNIDIPQIFKK